MAKVLIKHKEDSTASISCGRDMGDGTFEVDADDAEMVKAHGFEIVVPPASTNAPDQAETKPAKPAAAAQRKALK